MGANTSEDEKTGKRMGKEFKYGQMDRNWKVFGWMMSQMVIKYLDNYFKGYGKFFHVTGDIYEGEWSNGKANG